MWVEVRRCARRGKIGGRWWAGSEREGGDPDGRWRELICSSCGEFCASTWGKLQRLNPAILLRGVEAVLDAAVRPSRNQRQDQLRDEESVADSVGALRRRLV
jgi:hypothetical protein